MGVHLSRELVDLGGRLVEKLVAVREPEDAVTMPDTYRTERVGEPVGSLVEIAVAVAVLPADAGEPRGVCGVLLEHVRHRHLVEEVGHGSTTRTVL